MCHLVVIDDDDVDIARGSGGKRLVAGGAAIDGDDQLSTVIDQLVDRRRIGAVTFEDAVGDIDGRPDAEMAEKAKHQRRGGGAVDVVVTEDGDALAALDGAQKAGCRLFAIGQLMGIGHQAADRRIKEFDRLVHRHAAPGKHPGDQIRQSMDLRHGQRAFCPAWSSRATQRLSSADFSTPRKARCTGSTRSAMPHSADFICSFYRSSGDNIAMDLQTRVFTKTPPR